MVFCNRLPGGNRAAFLFVIWIDNLFDNFIYRSEITVLPEM